MNAALMINDGCNARATAAPSANTVPAIAISTHGNSTPPNPIAAPIAMKNRKCQW
jgi:hypothetical protein